MIPRGHPNNLAITWTELDAESSFGAWQYDSFTAGTVYRAATDGFVVAHAANSGGANPSLSGYTDSSNPPTTLIIKSQMSYVSGAVASITMPVRKNDYWKVVGANTLTPIISFLPLGT